MSGAGTMTAALLAAASLLTVAQAERPDGPPGPWLGPQGHVAERLAERLGLTEEQREQLESLRAKDREAMRPLHEAARQAHEALRSTLEASSPDTTAVGQAALAMHAAEKKLRAARDASLEALKAILTPEQREKLEQARARGFGPRHRHGPGHEPGHPGHRPEGR